MFIPVWLFIFMLLISCFLGFLSCVALGAWLHSRRMVHEMEKFGEESEWFEDQRH